VLLDRDEAAWNSRPAATTIPAIVAMTVFRRVRGELG
jgi:hypothetical protein